MYPRVVLFPRRIVAFPAVRTAVEAVASRRAHSTPEESLTLMARAVRGYAVLPAAFIKQKLETALLVRVGGVRIG